MAIKTSDKYKLLSLHESAHFDIASAPAHETEALYLREARLLERLQGPIHDICVHI